MKKEKYVRTGKISLNPSYKFKNLININALERDLQAPLPVLPGEHHVDVDGVGLLGLLPQVAIGEEAPVVAIFQVGPGGTCE